MSAVLPVDYWRSENDFAQAIVAPRPWQFVSPDRSIFIPVKQDFINNDLYYGIRMQDIVRTFGLSPATPGVLFYVSGESEEKMRRVSVGVDGSISTQVLFAEQGGEGLAVDTQGNVYIATGQILVYNPQGRKSTQSTFRRDLCSCSLAAVRAGHPTSSRIRRCIRFVPATGGAECKKCK